MKITTALQQLCHAEQMDAKRAEFQKHWQPLAEIYRKAGFSGKSLMHLEQLEWRAFLEVKEIT